MVSKAPLLSVLVAGCLVPERVALPPEVEDHQSMIFAVTSGDALRVSAHEPPLDPPLEPWTASGEEEVTFVAFLYDEPLDQIAPGLEKGTLRKFKGEGGQPIPNGALLLESKKTKEGKLDEWMRVADGALPESVEAFRLPPVPAMCPSFAIEQILLPCDKRGEHERDIVTLMLRADEVGTAFVTTSHGCAFLVSGNEVTRVADPIRPYIWLTGLERGPGHYIVTGDDASRVDFTITGTTVAASSEPRTVPDPNDHPVQIGGTVAELYAATFHGALWMESGGAWISLVDSPKGNVRGCAAPYAECHSARDVVYSQLGEVFVSNLRDAILHVLTTGSLVEEYVADGSNRGPVSALLVHSKHGLLAAHGSLPAVIAQRTEEEEWRTFQETSARYFIYVMRELGNGILFSSQQGLIGYVEAGLDCGVMGGAAGDLHHLVPLGDGTYLTGGDPLVGTATATVYRIQPSF